MKRINKILAIFLICITALSTSACVRFVESSESTTKAQSISLSEIGEYSGEPYVVINANVPEFSKSDYTTTSYESYGKLDKLGRCTGCIACVGTDLMPTEKRGEIGMIKPTGWHTVKYDNVDGKYLYNRCHLIAYMLTAENANERNLITGTRYMNTEGMLPFEDEVADYVHETGNHVLYRVTPIFEGAELLARGVHMEAYSVEDNGEGVSYNVFCYNAQPGIKLDYKTGESKADPEYTEKIDEDEKRSYIINTKSKKFHKESCGSVKDINPNNKKQYKGTRKALINNGYSPCKSCKP